jgi:hypothetical protein
MRLYTIPPAAEVRKPMRSGNNGGAGIHQVDRRPFTLESVSGFLLTALILFAGLAVGLAMMGPGDFQ